MATSTRLLALVLALVVAAIPALAQTKPFAYTPGTQRYRVTIATHNQRDQTGGRAPLEYDYTTSQYVTVTLAPEQKDRLAMTVTVDSIVGQSDMNAPPPDYSWAKGVRLTGSVTPNGRVIAFSPPANADPNVTLLYSGFRHFLPVVPATAGAGAAWADTSNERVQHRGPFDSVVTQVVINSKVTGDTTFAGQRVWRVERSGNIALSGDGTEGGKGLHLDGDGTVKGVHYLSPAGVFLGAKSSQTVRLVESFKDTGEGAPSTQTIRSQIEPLAPVRTAFNVSGIRR
jgi:hypothetical protein